MSVSLYDYAEIIYICFSGVIAKLSSMETKRMTTLQRELLRFVLIIASMAALVATLMVVLWAAWYVGPSIQISSVLNGIY